jgi:hypothetical protein
MIILTTMIASRLIPAKQSRQIALLKWLIHGQLKLQIQELTPMARACFTPWIIIRMAHQA